MMRSLLHSVSSLAMKQLWGEGNYLTEFDDMMKEKAITKGTKIMNILEMLKESSVYPQLGTMLLILLSLQLCGLSAVEYTLFPCLDLLLSNWSNTILASHFLLNLLYSPSHRTHCLWRSVVSSLVFFTLSGSFSGGNTRDPTQHKFLQGHCCVHSPGGIIKDSVEGVINTLRLATTQRSVYLDFQLHFLTSAVVDGQLLLFDCHSIW